jgi:hypothetical protein
MEGSGEDGNKPLGYIKALTFLNRCWEALASDEGHFPVLVVG